MTLKALNERKEELIQQVQKNKKIEKEKLKNLKVLVVDALRIDPHPTHFNLRQALDLVEELKPESAYFTHISHKLGFHAEVQANLPNNVFLAYDGLEVVV